MIVAEDAALELAALNALLDDNLPVVTEGQFDGGLEVPGDLTLEIPTEEPRLEGLTKTGKGKSFRIPSTRDIRSRAQSGSNRTR